jgi:hypothetical protein
MTLDEALNEIRTKPVVPLWPVVAVALDLSRGSTYAAAKNGEIEIITVGRLKKAITASLRRKLGLDGAAV